MLSLQQITSGYGNRQVIESVDWNLSKGEIVAILGHNGSGKSTLLKTIFGIVPIWSGEMLLDGVRNSNPSPPALLRLGVGYLPQANNVFVDLSVRENLQIGGTILPDRGVLEERIEVVLRRFPSLNSLLSRRAGTLSGGQRQLLALASTLVPAPRLLLLDEPSLGLAPRILAGWFADLKRLRDEDGVTIVVVEQKIREVLRISDSALVLRHGRVAFDGAAASLNDENTLRQVYL